MNIKIKYNKCKKLYIVKLDNKLLFNYSLKNKIKNNHSLKNYNYFIILKILRIFGLIKPIYNYKDYIYIKNVLI